MEPQIAQIGADYDTAKDPQTYAVIGAAMEVHCELGPGFLEVVYHHALAREFKLRQIPSQSEVALPVSYKGAILDCTYKVDFLCFDEVLVEIKAVEHLTRVHQAQVINYLKAGNVRKALLINFCSESLEYKRFVNRI